MDKISNVKEFIATMTALRVVESMVEAEEDVREATLSAEFARDGGLTLIIQGRTDFLLAALSSLFFGLADRAEKDPEELYLVLKSINSIKDDLEKGLDAAVEDAPEDDKLEIKFMDGVS